MTSWIAAHHNDNAVCVLMPVFSYKRGQNWMQEQSALKLLQSVCSNIDYQFFMQYFETPDSRDTRPASIPGRFVFPTVFDGSKSPWRQSSLFRKRRTPEITMLPARNMKLVEDLSPDALPTHTEDTVTPVKGAAKFAQIGEAAAGALITGMLTGAEFGNNQSVCIVAFNDDWGNFLDAFINNRAQLTVPTFCVSVAEDSPGGEGIVENSKEALTEKLLEGQITVPGHGPFLKEMPLDLIEQPPAEPTLNMLILGGPKRKQPQIPEQLLKKYSLHPRFRDEWSSVLEEFHEEFGFAEAGPEVEPTVSNSRKRQTDPNNTSTKKSRVDAGIIQDATVVTGSKLEECAVTNVKGAAQGLTLSVRVGPRIFLVNMSGAEVTMSSGMMVACFGKGGFKLARGGNLPEGDFAIQFQLAGHETKVLFNSTLMTLGEVVGQRQATHPDCKIAYHTMQPLAESPGDFSCESQYEIFFVPEKCVDNTATQMNIGAKVGQVKPWLSTCTSLVWSVRWTGKGLGPLRPVIVLTKDLELPSGRCVCLTGS